MPEMVALLERLKMLPASLTVPRLAGKPPLHEQQLPSAVVRLRLAIVVRTEFTKAVFDRVRDAAAPDSA